MTTKPRTLTATAAALLFFGAASCQKSSDPGAGQSGAASTATVAHVVFIDKKNACDCTRKRADDSWANLETALAKQSSIRVDRIYIDTEKDRAAPYLEMQNVMVIPGIYFLDEQGALIKLLQGEVAEGKIAAIVGG